MKYTVLSEQGPIHLAQAVNEYLIKGWRPQGGVFVDPATGFYLQAMVKG